MFSAWGRFVYRFRWAVLVVSVVLLAASGFVVSQGAKLQSGGFIETAESGRGSRLISKELPRSGNATFTLLYSSPTLSATDAAFRDAVQRSLEPLRADPRVDSIQSPYDPTAADPTAHFSRDRHAATVDVALKDPLDVASDYYGELRALVRSDTLDVQATGVVAITYGFNQVLESDLQRAETVSLPLALVLLLIVFGTFVAALLPLGVGVLAVMGGIAGMFLLARVTDVSIYAENVVTLIGLGVAIDYSLFITNRFREELHRGRTTEEAVAVALSTAGRAITFSGLTVAIGLSGMLFYQGTYLSSMGLAGAIVVASAVLYGLTFLPALLSVLERRIDLVRVPFFAPQQGDGRGLWHRIATAVMDRPVAVLIPVVAVILAIGSPFLRLHLANGDVTMLPKHEESRAAYDRLTADFPGAGQTHIEVIVRYDSQPLTAEHVPQLVDLQKKLEALPDVQKAQSAFSLDPRLNADAYVALYTLPADRLPPQLQALAAAAGPQLQAVRQQMIGPHVVLFDVVTSRAAYSDEAHDLVKAARALAAPPGSEKLVTGFSAIDLDTVGYIVDRTPAAVAYVMVATIVVLFLLLGSVVLPVKAVVMNLLSISASFGALVWVFQEGHLREQLGFTASGGIDPTLPVIMFCTLFGLSMDYEVLLLSRIQEEYARLGDNTHAVAEGLERSGRLITGAAAIMVGVFAAFGLAEILIIKALGLGMALAVAIDATLVRALVVPATMRLLGRVNWWAPAPLARLYRRLALSERHGEGLVTVPVASDTP